MNKHALSEGPASFLPLVRKLTRILGGVFVAVGLIIILSGIPGLYGQWSSRHWSSVPGRIVEGGFHAPRGQDQDTAVVEYAVDGKRHRHIVGYRPHSQTLEVGDIANLRRFSHGARVRVFYDPAETPELVDAGNGIHLRDRSALVTGFAPDAFEFLLAAVITVAVGLFFAVVPYRLLARVERSFAARLDDPAAHAQRVEVDTEGGSYRHVEVRARQEGEAVEPFVRENPYGVVLFDSTRRPMRLLGGGFGLLLWVIIFIALYFMEDHWGVFEYVILGGWAAWVLLVTGFVYEVRINRREGTAAKKFGWFFLTGSRRFWLRDFDRVVVESRLRSSRYDHLRERRHRPDSKFAVDLGGDRRLNLRVFGNLSDARRMAAEVAEYLGLPVVSDERVDP